MPTTEFTAAGGVTVERQRSSANPTEALAGIVDALDERLGMVLVSDTEYAGRYRRRGIGFVDPPLRVTARQRRVTLTGLTERARPLLAWLGPELRRMEHVAEVSAAEDEIVVAVAEPDGWFTEEQRSKQPSVFSVVRAIRDFLGSPLDDYLGLYGCLGYDLAFQFEGAQLGPRPEHERDLVLYLPDELVIHDPDRGVAERRRYEFSTEAESTRGRPRDGCRTGCAVHQPDDGEVGRALPRGGYADLVRAAKKAFIRGELFEVVLSQKFTRRTGIRPSELFRRLRAENPAPYGVFANLGDQEHLVGTSPEMYVRVSGRRVESCPLSGTVPRGQDAIEDAEQIRTLLNSAKDESELTMCTDVDRNDKARVCEPGSVRLLGRRQVELYSRVIHTADHVEGVLRDGFDGLDALMTHMWAVTVTGAPKAWAMRFIEDHEESARAWYGGAVGFIGCNGDVDTGLTIRMIRMRSGVAEVRAGATLLFDSVPEEEERETEVKADAMLRALAPRTPRSTPHRAPAEPPIGTGRRLIVVDHQDSFVHTLADYFRQSGAHVRTVRAPVREEALASARPDLVVLSPGPGQPADFDTSVTLSSALRLGVPIMGVCLGLQAIVEYFGGSLSLLPQPVHGKASEVRVLGGRLLPGVAECFTAGRYHSLFAAKVPDCLEITARTDDGVVMAVEHRRLPVAAVQFHPESVLTTHAGTGHRVVDAIVRELVGVGTGGAA